MQQAAIASLPASDLVTAAKKRSRAPVHTARLRSDMTTQVTVASLKAMIVQKLNLKGVTADSFADDGPLFGPQGIGLDSVDALELVLAIESEYGIQIQDAEVGKEAFASARVLCEFVNARRQGSPATAGDQGA